MLKCLSPLGKRNGKQIGLERGTILTTEKSIKCKEIIKKHATDFGGTLSDKEVMTLCQISRNSYYRYKRELKKSVGSWLVHATEEGQTSA